MKCEGRIGKAQSDSVDKAVKQTYSSAAGYSWDDYDSQVYRIDRADGRQAWVFAKLHYLSAGIVVAEREGFVQTAGLLPADALKRELDADGRVAIQINFATDKADLLPDAQPQIEQVLALLKNDPALRLSIEGHTDNTGGAEHNQALSEARAASVVAALTGAGIDASRLQAKGLGQAVPVAGNDDEPGRAKNRRVELVKR
jgi:outer membrane protein OmpA-like peptidoglycan-associated protein